MGKQNATIFVVAGIIAAVLLVILFGWVNHFTKSIGEPPATPPATEPPARNSPYGRVEAWRPKMEEWEALYGVPVDVQFVLMLKESGGHPQLQGMPIVWRGQTLRAQGLFQVMPFEGRFKRGEDPLNPDTNAREAFKWLNNCNRLAGGGWTDEYTLWKTFGCYFGGSPMNPNSWGPRTKAYADNVRDVYVYMINNFGVPTSRASVAAEEMQETEKDYPNRCRINLDCAYPANKQLEELAWRTGYYLALGWTPQNIEDMGVGHLRGLADCLLRTSTIKNCDL